MDSPRPRRRRAARRPDPRDRRRDLRRHRVPGAIDPVSDRSHLAAGRRSPRPRPDLRCSRRRRCAGRSSSCWPVSRPVPRSSIWPPLPRISPRSAISRWGSSCRRVPGAHGSAGASPARRGGRWRRDRGQSRDRRRMGVDPDGRPARRRVRRMAGADRVPGGGVGRVRAAARRRAGGPLFGLDVAGARRADLRMVASSRSCRSSASSSC